MLVRWHGILSWKEMARLVEGSNILTLHSRLGNICTGQAGSTSAHHRALTASLRTFFSFLFFFSFSFGFLPLSPFHQKFLVLEFMKTNLFIWVLLVSLVTTSLRIPLEILRKIM